MNNKKTIAALTIAAATLALAVPGGYLLLRYLGEEKRMAYTKMLFGPLVKCKGRAAQGAEIAPKAGELPDEVAQGECLDGFAPPVEADVTDDYTTGFKDEE